MPFDAASADHPAKSQKIAVIGTGISGLSCAWLLSQRHEVVVYEKAPRLGGHTNTVEVQLGERPIPVDTGFIVFNEPSYPNFTAFLNHLGVASELSCMSFGASIDDGRIEYSGQTLSSVFANRNNAASPTFWKMLSDIPRFHRDAGRALRGGFCEHASLGEFVAQKQYGRGFSEHFLKPMAAAIWSTPKLKIFDYPAVSFLKFFENHGLLQVLNLPEWRTVSGGARSYVQALCAATDWNVRLSSAVVKVEPGEGRVCVTDRAGVAERFDQVVIASHADAALEMLSRPDNEVRRVLSGFEYQPNHAVLHTDEGQMPKRRRAWSSWNYISSGVDGSVTYWMNRLQNLPCEENIFVTLNPAAPINPQKIIAEFSYDHPVFNSRSAAAQKDIWRIQGRQGVWFAGAHLGNGFHEDGLQAGLAVAEALGGVRRPWLVENESGRLYATTPLAAVA